MRLGLFVLAYNLGNFLRRLVLPGKLKHWSLLTLLVKLIKIGAKVLRHSRYVIFQMAEVAIRNWRHLLRYYPGSVDYDVVHNNELLSNTVRWTGISDR